MAETTESPGPFFCCYGEGDHMPDCVIHTIPENITPEIAAKALRDLSVGYEDAGKLPRGAWNRIFHFAVECGRRLGQPTPGLFALLTERGATVRRYEEGLTGRLRLNVELGDHGVDIASWPTINGVEYLIEWARKYVPGPWVVDLTPEDTAILSKSLRIVDRLRHHGDGLAGLADATLTRAAPRPLGWLMTIGDVDVVGTGRFMPTVEQATDPTLRALADAGTTEREVIDHLLARCREYAALLGILGESPARVPTIKVVVDPDLPPGEVHAVHPDGRREVVAINVGPGRPADPDRLVCDTATWNNAVVDFVQAAAPRYRREDVETWSDERVREVYHAEVLDPLFAAGKAAGSLMTSGLLVPRVTTIHNMKLAILALLAPDAPKPTPGDPS